ncbi:hypothetical protein CC79DRAFT_1273027 [Sarocladium strictum]
MRSTSSIAAFAGLLGSAHAFWRMECPGRVGLARIDPLVSPGTASAHAHSIHGSSAFNENSNSAELMSGDCTSCRVTQDLSAYWHPAVYFEDKSGEFELVPQVGGMLAYYLLFGDNITAFPEGFQMMAGDTDRREYTLGDPNEPDPEKSTWGSLGQTKQSDLEQRALGFNCLNYQRAPEGTLYRHKLPDKEFLDANCADGVRFELMFPSCWNGHDLDSSNHKKHVAYPDLVMTGTCPEDFPIRLPSILYEVIWNTNAFNGRDGRFVVSNGDPTGFGYHGDFITGWKPEFLQSAVDTCTSETGRIEDCPLFNVVDESTAQSCSMDKGMKIMSENVKGPMKSLPGDVPIISEQGPEKGDEPAPDPPKPTSQASMTYAPGELPSDPAKPLPGQVFKESGLGEEEPAAPTSAPAPEPSPKEEIKIQAAPVAEVSTEPPAASEAPPAAEPIPEEPPAPTPEPEVPEPEPTVSYFKTEYVTNGAVVSKILWEEEFVTVTEQIDATTTVVSPAVPTDARRRRHLLGHRHRHL